MELIDILAQVSVVNRDNGKRFTQTDRLDAISSLLWNSSYRRINSDGLFNLYAKRPIEQLTNESIVVISSHVDCERGISNCFTSAVYNDIMHGTYDNAITNVAIISAMLTDQLPDHVLIALTGDEEVDSKGAKHLLNFLQSKSIEIKVIVVLDVTDMGWTENADFTVENNFWSELLGSKIVEIADSSSYNWRFVPSDVNEIPQYVSSDYVIMVEAEEDESWYYDEEKQQCFSFCLPVYGEMHSDDGVLIRKEAFYHYAEMLVKMLREI